MTAFSPARANAFWPFSTSAADAATNVFIPGSGTPALHAAINADPNPSKGLGDNIQTSGGRALLASAGPSGTLSDVVNTPVPGRISVYVVRSGDTLSEIAKMFGVSVNTILWANDLASARSVKPGDTLIILPISGIEHTIKKGDTLKSLAKKYDADADEIAQFNGLDPDASLSVGTTIIVPGGEIIPPAPAQPKRQPGLTLVRSGGSFQVGYYMNPVPNGAISQGLHGWNGVDIAAARGTPVYAAADGVVIIARSGGWNGGYGNYIVITHDNGTQTLYSHMRSNVVSSGQAVLKGQIIGYVGATGRATGPHLHFEVRGATNPLISCAVGSICAPK